ncbi:hypothetical protein ABT324_03775 [Saccharopolyspora sp. NPDC000359]|uniref:hypothetical protein n=1 Tax=Saccharopolyspora sp. NPDC000359 TaxID=3154251 RepID=UPI00331EF0E0
MSGATRSRVRRALAVGLPVLAVGTGILAAGWFLPSPSAVPGYTGVPNACESVSQESLREAFEPRRAEVRDQHHGIDGQRHTSKCQWRTEGPVHSARKTRLQVQVAVEFDREARPDTAYANQFLDYLALEPGAAEVPDLAGRAVLIRSPRDVQLVAAKANMTIEVRYSAAKPTAELEPVARTITEELLTTAGDPK